MRSPAPIGWVAIAVALCVTRPASAEPSHRIAVLPTDAGISMPTLIAQLRLHAGDVDLAAAAGSDDLRGRSEAAAAIIDAGEAALVIWVDPLGDGFIAYAVGPWPDRAAIEVVRIEPGARDDGVERIVALKVGSLLDQLLREERTAPVLGLSVTRPAARWRIALGGVIARGDDTGVTSGLEAAAERALEHGIRAGVRSRWLPVASTITERAETRIREVSCAATISAAIRARRWQVFAAVSLGASIVDASATTEDDRRGQRAVVVPSAEVGVGIRARISGGVALVATAGYERWLVRQRFLVQGDVAADLGADRISFGLALSLPLR